ncbi:unnamed protein product [Acanthoscelides obtectus]|uniref:Uncharacterized protein n=1 Tax=Acanthoscelides obtectus TaxID=200917 RepID=A0A9P0KRF7_ACAOB|nr:unnamed protein product [Acanthoscelides obtectus]CAK1639228.1 hypothetical protein AOBTE_LOCUS11056 [Acanthoscelides obtectus]
MPQELMKPTFTNPYGLHHASYVFGFTSDFGFIIGISVGKEQATLILFGMVEGQIQSFEYTTCIAYPITRPSCRIDNQPTFDTRLGRFATTHGPIQQYIPIMQKRRNEKQQEAECGADLRDRQASPSYADDRSRSYTQPALGPIPLSSYLYETDAATNDHHQHSYEPYLANRIRERRYHGLQVD